MSYPRTGICELAVGREDALNWILSRSRVRSHEALDLVAVAVLMLVDAVGYSS